MASVNEYMQLSEHVYASSDNNDIGLPIGWTELDWEADGRWTGFSAGVYKKGNEIVIAYAGTNDNADKLLNWLGVAGFPAAQYFMRTTRRALRNPGCAPLVNIEAPVFRRLRM